MAAPSGRREIDAAWRAFVLDGRAPLWVKPEILRSWKRTKSEGQVDPALQVCPDAQEREDLLARSSAADDGFRASGPLISEFADRLSSDGHVVGYFDSRGVMLALHGNGRTRERLAEINFAPGACWSETAAGTNGVGTALVEGTPLEVFASEHFVEAWQRWTCASVPVRVEGDVVGIVDITSPWTERHPNLLVCAEALARAVEGRLEALAAQRAEAIREAFRGRAVESDRLAVDLRGRFLAVGPAVRRLASGPEGFAPDTLAPVLDRIRGLAPGAGEFEHEVMASGRSVRLACRAVVQGGRAVGAILRVVDGAAPRGRSATSKRRPRYEFESILGSSMVLRRQLQVARVAAGNAFPVLILGESGTGKEMFAQAIHSASARAQGPFVALNCGSIPPSLLETELFGYEAGSFTGGRKDGHTGKFEDADQGTLFLDEVSELSPHAQIALLRMLQEREVVRIGSSEARPVDVRIIAAANKDLGEEILQGRFRRDLYYRLNVLRVELPPLRSRREDIPLLAAHHLAVAQLEIQRGGLTFSPEALALLSAYDWPGNVRELKNVVERATVAATGPRILASELPPELQGSRPTGPAAEPALPLGQVPEPDREPEREALVRALNACAWNVVQAARTLGISRRTMYRKLEKLEIRRR